MDRTSKCPAKLLSPEIRFPKIRPHIFTSSSSLSSMSFVPSFATPFNVSLFNSSILASSARKKDNNEEENAEENEKRKWQMIGREAKWEEGIADDNDNDGDHYWNANDNDGDEATQVIKQHREDGTVQAQCQQQQQRHREDGAVQAQCQQQQQRHREDGAVQAQCQQQQQRHREDGAVQAQCQQQQQRHREDGAVQAQCQQQQQRHMDLPAIAIQLVQQAMLRNEGVQLQCMEHEKFALFGGTVPSSSPSAHSDARSTGHGISNTAKGKKCGTPSLTGAANGRRAGSKGFISAAATAALMAPSPLGALPAIPGALAVAASPAAQLFREDDWSWHRNPAAAIRSGGTNKQTPVWKYFVYNKAENLSRCIVGTCTYQLKGPHTSTLACHLKKHTAEYAEFQRLKNEYTRERMANGQTSSDSSAGGDRPSSARSTPFGGHPSDGFLSNGTDVPDDFRSQKSLSPSILSNPLRSHGTKSSNASSPILTMLGGRFANCAVIADESIGRNFLPRGTPANSSNGESGIFGSQQQHSHHLGGHVQPQHFAPSHFQQFLAAAAVLAGQNGQQQQQQQRLTSPTPQLDCLTVPQMESVPKKINQFEANSTTSGVGQHEDQCQNCGFSKHQLKKDTAISEDSAKGGGTCVGGTGENLLYILDFLSKKAEAAASKEKEQNAQREKRERTETEDDQRKAMKRKYTTKRRESDDQGKQREDGEQRNERLEGSAAKDEVTTDEDQTQSHLRHSVECILKDEGDKEEEDMMAKKRPKTEVEEQMGSNSPPTGPVP